MIAPSILTESLARATVAERHARAEARRRPAPAGRRPGNGVRRGRRRPTARRPATWGPVL